MIISFEYIPLNGKIEDNDAEKDTIIDDDEKFQLISVNKLGLSWAKLSSSWDWALLQL